MYVAGMFASVTSDMSSFASVSEINGIWRWVGNKNPLLSSGDLWAGAVNESNVKQIYVTGQFSLNGSTDFLV
jgi:hypothetical protein